MKKNFDVMVDIETLGTKPDSTVFQIAAAVFDIKTGELQETFNMTADISCSKPVVDGSTIKWWLETDKELFAKLLSSGNCSEDYMFQQFHVWMEELAKKGDIRLWGNGILFDNNFIRTHFEMSGLKYPVKYNNDRDVRTILQLVADKLSCTEKELKEKFRPEDCHDHDAFDDVRKQVQLVSGCYNILVEPAIPMNRFTADELAIMRVLKENLGIEYLACDQKFGLHGFIGKPSKLEAFWSNHEGFRIGVNGITSIKWEEAVPVCISDYV